jgi:4'-phosphopantetheinyl transferase
MIDVCWVEQRQSDVPAHANWLSEGELLTLGGLRFAKRRADWLLGRWTAKRALASYLGLSGEARSLARIELPPASSGAPQPMLAGMAAAASISLSHRAGVAACAVAVPDAVLGCDLELVEPRSEGFIADYFTGEEQELFASAGPGERFRLAALLWSGKESALKAMRVGLRFDVTYVSIDPLQAFEREAHEGSGNTARWRPLRAAVTTGQMFEGWWQRSGEFVKTLVAHPSPRPPRSECRNPQD